MLQLTACGLSTGQGEPCGLLPVPASECQLLFCLSGQVILRFSNQKAYIAKRGDVLLFTEQTVSEYRLGAHHHVMWVRFDKAEAKAMLSAIFPAAPVCALGTVPAPIRHGLDALLAEYAMGLPQREQACHAHLTLLLSYLQRAAQKVAVAPPKEFEKLLPAVCEIENDCAASRAVADYAKLCRLSEYYFIRLFHQYKGMSPAAYRTHVRMERACRLLAEGTDSIAQIGQAVGYDDPAHFCKQFKSQIGQTPRDYRKSTIEKRKNDENL